MKDSELVDDVELEEGEEVDVVEDEELDELEEVVVSAIDGEGLVLNMLNMLKEVVESSVVDKGLDKLGDIVASAIDDERLEAKLEEALANAIKSSLEETTNGALVEALQEAVFVLGDELVPNIHDNALAEELTTVLDSWTG